MKFFLFISLSIVACNSWAQPSNCDVVHEGTFWVMGKKGTPIIEITRNASKQSETVIESGAKVNYQLQWVSSCQFTLTPLDTNTVGAKRNIVWILKLKKGYYEYKTTQLFRPEMAGKIYMSNALNRSEK